MDKCKWLENLKIGDTVFVSTGAGWGITGYVAKVKRFTKTLIIVEQNNRESKFRKRDGQEPGESWYRDCLREYTDELKDEVLVQNLKVKARKLKDNLHIPENKDELLAFIKALGPFVREKGA